MEHVTYELGNEYLEEINRTAPDISDLEWEKYRENDYVGNPKFFFYAIKDKRVSLSSSMFRYLKVYVELNKLFTLNTLKSIAEIGIGYGGEGL